MVSYFLSCLVNTIIEIIKILELYVLQSESTSIVFILFYFYNRKIAHGAEVANSSKQI